MRPVQLTKEWSAGGLLAMALLAGPVAAQEIIHRWPGSNVTAQWGRGAEVGDLTGDGVPDLAMLEDLGQLVGRIAFLSGVDGSLIDEVVRSDYSQAQVKIRSLDDFDGDGVKDVLIGQPVLPLPLDEDGVVRVVSGATRETLFEQYGVDGAEELLGYSISAPGDVDQDGYADALYIGLFGTAWLCFGPDGSRVRTHGSFGGRTTVAGVGDANGDGYPDYAVGSPQFNAPGTINVGKLNVYSGVDGTLLHEFVGEENRDFLGVSAAAAGDLDGDGFGDVLVGAPGGSHWFNVTDGGLVRIYSGRNGAVLWEERRSGSSSNFGAWSYGGRDFTGDGVVDWIVVDSRASGSTGVMSFYSGADRALLWERSGEEFGSLFLPSVFFSDDLNGDGVGDVGYGDLAANPGGVGSAGILWVVAGAPGAASPYCPASVNSSGRRAKLELDGPISVGNNALALEVRDAVPGTFGLFFYGTEPRQTGFGDGIRCVGGTTQRLFPPMATGDDGTLRRELDFTLPPVAPGAASPIEGGATRYFQFWFRDPGGPGGSGFNLSNGMEILFTP